MPDETPTLAQIVAALSVTYKDEGVLIWLRHFWGVHGDETEQIPHMADAVRRIVDVDPSDFTITDARSER